MTVRKLSDVKEEREERGEERRGVTTSQKGVHKDQVFSFNLLCT
jgi:hypothetical protein